MTTYHVSISGNDSNSGTTSTSAWRNINVGCSRLASGDELIVHAGVYSEFVYITTANVIVRAADGERPIIDGTALNWGVNNDSNYRSLVDISAANVTFKGFELRNCLQILHSRGIDIGGTAGSPITGMVVIDDCKIHDINEEGIVAEYQNGCVIQNCEIYRCVWGNKDYAQDIRTSTHGATLVMNRGTQYKAINNDVYENWGECITSDFGSSNVEIAYNRTRNHISQGIYLGHCQDAHVHHNACWSSDDSIIGRADLGFKGNGIGVTDENYVQYGLGTFSNTERIDIHDNLVFNCNNGIWLATDQSDTGEGTTEDVLIYNNTIVDCVLGVQLYWRNAGDFSGCEFKNNLVYGSSLASISASMTGWTFDYNSWTTTPTALAIGANDQVGTQELVNPTPNIYGTSLTAVNFDDYRITSASTAIDNGATGLTLNNGYAMTTDFFGLTRGAADIDIGCHEYDGVVVEDPNVGLLIAQDAGRMALHGSHVNTTIVASEARGRYFNGTSAYVKLQSLVGKFTPDAGSMGILWKAAAGTHTDGMTRHIVEVYGYDETNGASSYWIIRQNGDETITFTVMIDGVEITPITVANTSYSAQFLGLTWDSTGSVAAYVDTTPTTTELYPAPYVADGMYFFHIGQGGTSYNMRGVAADFVFMRGAQLDDTDMGTLATAVLAGTLDATALDGLSDNWSWYGLYDDVLLDPADPVDPTCVLTADVTVGEVPLTVTFDWSTSEFDPADPVVSYLLFVKLPGTSFSLPSTTTDYAYIYTQVGIGFESAICRATLESGQVINSNTVAITLYETVALPNYPDTAEVTAIEDRCDLLELASDEFLALVTP